MRRVVSESEMFERRDWRLRDREVALARRGERKLVV